VFFLSWFFSMVHPPGAPDLHCYMFIKILRDNSRIERGLMNGYLGSKG
jgi:hypothetical protein